jgi:hypothetical protein
MSGLRSSVALAARRRPRLSGARSTCAVEEVDQLDLRLLEEAVQLLDVGLVHVQFGHRGGDLAVREHARLLALDQQTLDLFEFLKFCHRHFRSLPGKSLAPSQRACAAGTNGAQVRIGASSPTQTYVPMILGASLFEVNDVPCKLRPFAQSRRAQCVVRLKYYV